MKIADRFGDIPQNAEFALTALHTLAGDDAPEAARREAVARAAKGEKITLATARAIKDRHAPPDAPFTPAEVGHSNESPLSDTLSAHDVRDGGEAVQDPIEDRGSDSLSSARRKAQPTVLAKQPGVPSLPDETSRCHWEATNPGPPNLVSPDELVEAIDRLLALLPVDTRTGWGKFVRKVRQLPAERRLRLVGKLTSLSDAAVNVRRNL